MQSTLATTLRFDGVGLHGGRPARMTIRPAPAGTGIVFHRIDVTDRDPVVPARWDAVVDARLCTVIANAAGVTVSTVEHVMAALYGLGVDNAAIDIDGHFGWPQASLISTFTPAARSSFISASTVWALGCTMSSSRL